MINPSNLDLQSLPWLPLTERSAFPKQAAIYFAIDSTGCVQYIGRSVNVHARWGSHHKYSQLEAIGKIKIAYLFVDMPELLPQIETALIEYFKPLLNFTNTKCLKTVDKVSYGIDRRIRVLFKEFIKAKQIKRMSEGVAVEKAMLQAIALDRLVNKSEPLTYESIEKEIESVWIELSQEVDTDD